MRARSSVDPIAQVREEVKYLLDRREADELLSAVSARIGPPPPVLVRSVYFDRADLPFAARARSEPSDCLKLRAKAYGPDGGLDEICWAEVKRQRGSSVEKRRFPVVRAALDRAVQGRFPDLALRMGASAEEVEAAREARAAFAAVAGAAGPLVAVVAVRYQRRVCTEVGRWRLTVDDRIGYRTAAGAASAGLGVTEAPLCAEPWVVVELKQCAPAPRWLARLLRDRAPELGFSKFVRAVEATCRPPLRALQLG